jgi:hypothetical protein
MFSEVKARADKRADMNRRESALGSTGIADGVNF